MTTTKKSPYPFLLRFVREFTHGTVLVGTMHADSIGFCSREDAEGWVETINAKNAKDFARHAGRGYVPGSLTYRVASFEIEVAS
jgi:hypothetical protein